MTDLAAKPLNGERTHPLTAHARANLALIRTTPKPKHSFNPGVVDRLTRQPNPLAEVVSLVSPYPSHRGKKIPHLRITAAGLAELGDA